MKAMIEQLIQHPEFLRDEFWRRIEVEGDTQIIAQGEIGQYFYLLESGMLRVLGKIPLDEFKNMNPGVYDVKPGEIVGELVLFDREPRSATVKTLEKSTLLEFDAAKTMAFLNRHPEIGFEFMRKLMTVMVGRLRSSNQKIFSLLAWGVKARGIEKDL